MEQEGQRPVAQSPDEASTRGVWFNDRAFGLIALTLAAAGQVTILLGYLFTPDEPASIVEVDIFERHWTDNLVGWWLGLSAAAGLVALLGLVVDKHRDAAAVAVGVAFIGFVWPWGA